ncbi:3-hydroxyacyl-CoA dehydrogenase family protein [Janibacter sp. LM]|uniref:3-hydroxyacyl-CoA dehydrogenase family protein n=1 Tax=Janibacter sp. LM TaxID=3144845 RepID=UPI0031F6442E
MRLTIIGSGAMGSQIAMVSALSGHDVVLYDLDPDAPARAVTSLRHRLDRQVDKGRRSREDVDAAFARLGVVSDLESAVADADLVIEAVVERVSVKRDLFARIGRVCPQHTVLASNSSSIVPSKLADASGRPDRFCNIHFFNPALVMKGVEVVRGQETSDATMTTAVEYVEGLGKQPIVLEKEIFGFVANRVLNAVRDEAISLHEGGYASVEAIDAACRTALGYPMGPFELMDLTGIDIGYHSKTERYAETGDPADRPSRSVTELVEAGHLGRKTGRGWYTYETAGD